MVDPYAIVRRLTGYELISPKDARLLTEAVDGLIGEIGSKDARMKELEAENARLRALLERNKELEQERDQLLDKLHCMCGSPIDHSAWEGHTPVSVYDYSLDQERSRAEAAEAKLAEAMKALAEVRRRARNIWGACSSDQIIDKDVERQAKLMLEYIDAARACLEKGNSDGE